MKVTSPILLSWLVLAAVLSVFEFIGVTAPHNNLMQESYSDEPIGGLLWPDLPHRMPKILPKEDRNQPVLLVHVGKTGGSTIRKLANTGSYRCVQLSDDNNSNSTKRRLNRTAFANSKPFFCSLGRVTKTQKDVAHMWVNQHTQNYANYSQYLVPVRNPIDRLISWYKYELNYLKTGKLKRTGKGASKLVQLFDNCSFSDINTLITDGMIEPPHSSEVSATKKIPFCQKLATDCLVGNERCYAHNYYNYELYMEDLIRWRGSCVYDETSGGNTNGESQFLRKIRIDVIRAEHSESDWKRVLELWTGGSKLTSIPVLKALKNKANTAKRLNVTGTDQVPQMAIERLCRSICVELVAYKKAIALADNLLFEEVEESYRELDERCGMSVDETCGTEFHYRNIKSSKFLLSR